MKYTREINKIKNLMSEETLEILASCNAIIAGGAVTSVFCNSEVNDIDYHQRIHLKNTLNICVLVFQ